MGQLYQRGRIWWVKYYVNGRPVRESTGVMKEQEARRFLKAREGDTAKGLPMLPRADRLRYEDAVADLKQHYATTGDRDLEEAGWRLAHLEPCFRGRRLASIGRAEVTAYANRRQSEGASNATINRELGVLGRMLKLAYENSKLVRLPIIRKLKEGAPREGFFEDHQYQAVRWRPPEDLQVAIDIMHTFGWRKVLGLERRQLDLKAGTLRLDPGSTKNDEGRVGVPHSGAQVGSDGPRRPRGGPTAPARADRPRAVSAHREGEAGRDSSRRFPEGLGDRV